MGLTTQYLRYVPGSAFGLVGTERCVRFVTKYSQTGRYVAAPACEFVLIWDCKRSSKVGQNKISSLSVHDLNDYKKNAILESG